MFFYWKYFKNYYLINNRIRGETFGWGNLMKKILLGVATAMFLSGFLSAVPALGAIQGQCADCHTMHNSEQNQPIAKVGVTGTITATPLPNLLRMDCIACHAQNTGDRIVVLPGGSQVPQVYHEDASDLAAGNFAYIPGAKGVMGSNRKGHNVIDFSDIGADAEFAGLGYPPGMYMEYARHNTDRLVRAENLTCAGTNGCHGVRNQLIEEGSTETKTGLTAIRGAHHLNNNDQGINAEKNWWTYPGEMTVAGSYRFLMGVKGLENPKSRWQNVSSDDHNEYLGSTMEVTLPTSPEGLCRGCHFSIPPKPGGSADPTTTTLIRPENASMSGFCITCHGAFHSTGGGNGTSGAFLRHPSDYVLPESGEYQHYTNYEISAPVARNAIFIQTVPGPFELVRAGEDMVMCLSCHQAHATPYNGMLRFDYASIIAGDTEDRVGCFACHTTKGFTSLVSQ
jgi:hypothetical protein